MFCFVCYMFNNTTWVHVKLFCVKLQFWSGVNAHNVIITAILKAYAYILMIFAHAKTPGRSIFLRNFFVYSLNQMKGVWIWDSTGFKPRAFWLWVLCINKYTIVICIFQLTQVNFKIIRPIQLRSTYYIFKVYYYVFMLNLLITHLLQGGKEKKSTHSKYEENHSGS